MTAGKIEGSVGVVTVTESSAAPRPLLARWLRSPRTVAAAVLLVYAFWIAAFLLTGHQARDFADVGTRFVRQSHASAVIAYDPRAHYDPTSIGYDGQFCYYIALDPANARYYMDWPAYRYGRILYPVTARVLALGQAALVPYTLILVNWLALGGGTLALAAWLRRKGLSPWLALLFGLYPGLFIALRLDLTEPLGYAFVVLGVYLFDYGPARRRVLWAALSFALGVLARETTAVFPAVYALALLVGPMVRRTSPPAPLPGGEGSPVAAGEGTLPRAGVGRGGALKDTANALGRGRTSPPTPPRRGEGSQRDAHDGDGCGEGGLMATGGRVWPWLASLRANWRPAAMLLGVALAPYVVYKLFLAAWLGSSGVPTDALPLLIPFQGLLVLWPWHGEQLAEIETTILPALLCAGLAFWALVRRQWRVEIAALLLNIQLFIVMLNPYASDYLVSEERVTTGVVLAALLCLPIFARLGRPGRLIFCASAAIWIAPLAYWMLTTW
jgi:hypothetical protein